jgi:uncharacterized membrane protein
MMITMWFVAFVGYQTLQYVLFFSDLWCLPVVTSPVWNALISSKFRESHLASQQKRVVKKVQKKYATLFSGPRQSVLASTGKESLEIGDILG